MHHLYKDFQWEIIFKILSVEKHFNLYIDKEKQTVDRIDEKRVDSILTKKYMNGSNLDMLKSMFNMVFLHHADKDEDDDLKLPYLDHSIVNLLNSFRLASLKNTSEGFALISNFKSINDMVIVKTARSKEDNLDILYEYFIGSMGINKLRNMVPNFCYTLGIFKCNPLPLDDYKIDTDKFCSNDRSDSRFYVIYEKINGESLHSYCTNMKTDRDRDMLISYLIQIVLALQIAQREISFVHYDLHSDNIMIRKLPAPIVVEYKIDDKIYKVETDAIPTIIDYGFSHFVYQGIPFGMKDIKSVEIVPTKTSKGYDLHKLLNFIMYSTFNVKLKQSFKYLSWMLNYYENQEDSYGIYHAFKNNDSKELDKAFAIGWKNYFAVKSYNKKLYNDEPINFIHWLERVYPNTFKKFIKVSNSEYSNPDISIVDSYRAKIEGKRIFNADMIDELKDCSILDKDHKSYIINKYIINEFKSIIDNFGDYISDKNSISTKIDRLDRSAERNKTKYINNDNELLNMYIQELKVISYKMDVDKYIDLVDKVVDIVDVKRLNPKIDTFIKYNSTYSNYKLFIDYSKISNRISIDKNLEETYYKSKKLYSEFSRKKSEYIFDSLRQHLDIVNSYIYDVKYDIVIEPKNWVPTEKFYKSLRLSQYILNDIRYFYPDITYACNSIEDFISKIVLVLGMLHKVYLYLFPKSMNQIKQAYSCDPNRLVTLIMKSMKRTITPSFVHSFIQESINRDKTDKDIYLALRKYVNTSYDKDKRAQSRVRDLYFLFNYYNFQTLTLNREFKYLDIGGNDGSITAAIGKHIRLDKGRIFCADVDDWFDNVFTRNKDVTHIRINKIGRLPFSDETFSLITAFQVFHHIEDIHDRLQELNRIIKKGGFLVIREHDNINECIQTMIDIEHSLYEVTLKEEPNTSFLDEYRAYYLTSQQWTILIESYGFRYIEIDYNTDMRIKNSTRTYYAMYQKI